ncbi:unnamed protein product [Cylindrotheca closterium]|uniref:Uncharacterized protein n=1 Tax=Cylindrotheca closterium TaxID=2856 RepID=A0AAD2D0G2_9STRA|nr:unnamed protein product [Cylindrotheca closterium]
MSTPTPTSSFQEAQNRSILDRSCVFHAVIKYNLEASPTLFTMPLEQFMSNLLQQADADRFVVIRDDHRGMNSTPRSQYSSPTLSAVSKATKVKRDSTARFGDRVMPAMAPKAPMRRPSM